MELLWALIIGLVVGVIAKAIMPGRDPGGAIVSIVLGIVGSLVALFIGRAAGIYDRANEAPGFIASILGAIVVLAVYRALTRRRTAS